MTINTNFHSSIDGFARATRHAARASAMGKATRITAAVGMIGVAGPAGFGLSRGIDHVTGWYSQRDKEGRSWTKGLTTAVGVVGGAIAAIGLADNGKFAAAAAASLGAATLVVSTFATPVDARS